MSYDIRNSFVQHIIIKQRTAYGTHFHSKIKHIIMEQFLLEKHIFKTLQQ